MTANLRDPAAVLVIKRLALQEACEASYDAQDEDSYYRRRDRASRASDRLDRRIVSTVATSAEGLIAQVRLATGSPDRWHCIDDDDVRGQLAETIIAGIRALIAA